MIHILLLNLAVVFVAVTLLWGVSVIVRDSSIIDPCWGLGFVIVAITTLLAVDGIGPRGALMAILVTIWGLRLFAYLTWRNWGHGEDPRYEEMRQAHGDKYWYRSLYRVFWLQAGLLWFISFPVQFGMVWAKQSLGLLDCVGVVVWGIGLFFEAVGDYQLARFRSRPENEDRVLDEGLWRYTRHPNYFGDFCVWWGLYLIAAAGGAWGTLASPVVMSIFLMYVSGVTLTERTITDRRPNYAEYKRTTNAFFPGPRRKG